MLANVVSKVLVMSNGAGKGQGFHATMWPAILEPCWFSLLRALFKAFVACLTWVLGEFQLLIAFGTFANCFSM